MSYTLTFQSGGTTGTFLPDVGFKWTDRLNVVNEANFVYSSSSAFNRSKVDIGAIILITEGASVEFFGYVDDITTTEGGGMNVHATGQEGWLGREHGAYTGSPWTTTNNVTIFNAIIAESSHLTAGSSDSFGTLDFSETASDSLWNAIKNLSEKTSQDLNIIYSTTAATIGLVNTRQSASGSRDILNYGKEIGNIAVGRTMPLGNKILVYGKGEGTTRIKSEYPTHGYSAASQVTWGVITKIIEDYSITTVAEANLLADAEVARYKDPVKSYEFSLKVKRFKTDFIAGDTITLNSAEQGLINETVRITEIEKGMENGVEFINLTVTNAAYSRLVKNRDMLMAQIQKTYQQSSTYDQYQTEYSNQNCSTCIGGNSCFLSTGEWNLAGKLFHCVGANPATCLCNIFFAYDAAAKYLSFDAGMTVCVPYLQVGDLSPGCTSTNTLHKTNLDMCGCNIIHAGTVCATCFCGSGTGGSLWTAGTAPYIIPCNSCFICSPCINITCGVITPQIENGGGAIAIYAASTTVACFGYGTYSVLLGQIRAKDIHPYANGSCCVGITACRFFGGYINNLYACSKMVLPVGANCY